MPTAWHAGCRPACRLAPFLPEQHRTPRALAELANSTQFKQQLKVFGHALATGQLDMAQFGLSAEVRGWASSRRLCMLWFAGMDGCGMHLAAALDDGIP